MTPFLLTSIPDLAIAMQCPVRYTGSMAKKKDVGGRPRSKTYGNDYVEFRLKPSTLKMLRIMAAYLDAPLSDMADEALQVGLGYIYARRRQNLAQSMREIPEIWQKLNTRELEHLRGTEYPPI